MALVGIGLLGIAAQWLAWRLRLPAILFLLVAGLAAGPGLGFIEPDRLFGELLFPFISLSVAVILFEGGLTLKLSDIRGMMGPVRRLLTIGLLVTWLLTALAAHYFVGLSLEVAVLFGAITVVTGPTVIVPLVRAVRPTSRIARILRWEGIVIDPLGALLAVLVFEFLLAQGEGTALLATVATFIGVILVGTLLGAICGQLLGLALRNAWLPDYLHNLTALVAVFVVFLLANSVYHETGLLAVTVMGMWLANMRRVPLDHILHFKESLSLLLISGLFVLLAARLELSSIWALGGGAIALLLVMQLLIRPLAVLVSTVGSPLGWRERALIGWIAPRGIVAAAVSAVFALRMEEVGYQGADVLVPLTFLVIIFTVVLQSATSLWLAKRLGVREPPPRGVLIVGATEPARMIGRALKEEGIPILVADASQGNIQRARMEGLPVYRGNPTSEHAEQRLELSGLGWLIAMTPSDDLNRLCTLHFTKDFGLNRVFRLPPSDVGERRGDGGEVVRRRGENVLFSDDATYGHLAGLVFRGAAIRTTRLSGQFRLADYREQHPEALPLFAIDRGERLHVFGQSPQPEPAAGWRILSLIPETGPVKQSAPAPGPAPLPDSARSRA